MALEGSIKDFGLPDILEFVSSNRKTGVLTLRHKEDAASLGFQDGDIVAADYGRTGMTDQISRYLVKAGRCTPEQMRHLEDLVTATGTPLTEILQRENVLTAEGLEEIVRYKIQEVVDEIFTWKEGTYRFDPDVSIYSQSTVKAAVPTSAVLLEGMRRIDEWPRIEESLPTPNIILARVQRPVLEVSLSPEQSRLLDHVDGKRTISDLTEVTGLGRFRTYHALYDLLETGQIEKAGVRIQRRERETRRVPVATRLGLGAALLAGFLVILIASLALARFQSFFLVPWGRPGPRAYYSLVQTRRLENIRLALDVYALVHGTYPGTLTDLVRDDLLATSQLSSPVNRRLTYRLLAGGTSYVLSAE